MPRRRGLRLVEHAANLQERQILRIVTTQPETVARFERSDRGGDAAAHQTDIAHSLRIDVTGRSGTRSRRFVLGQRILASRATHAIDVPLRQHSPQPCGQAAATVKVTEMGSPLAVAHVQSEQFSIKRVRQIA